MSTQIDKKIDALTQAIEKLLAREVAPIAPVLPVAPIAPIVPIVQQNSGDHDLLTKLDTKVDQIQADVTELKKQGVIYVTQTEHQEVVRIQRVHDGDIEILKSFKDTLTGKIWGIGIIAGFGSGVLMLIIQHYFIK